MIPLRTSNYIQTYTYPNNIIIHHTACKFDIFNIDDNEQQIGRYTTYSYRHTQRDTGFNYIMELVGDDYVVTVSQPLFTICKFDDIEEKYWGDVHIAVLGNYNRDILPNRAYRMLAYRLICPFMRAFRITENNVFFHHELSKDDKVTCPGSFVERLRLITQIRAIRKILLLRRAVNQRTP